MATKRHVVTGAAGLIGHELTRQLLADGAEVLAVDYFKKYRRDDLQALKAEHGGRLQIVDHDLTTGVPAELLNGPWNTIYHFAAIVGVAYVNANPYETIRSNMLSTFALSDAAIKAGCQTFAFASSSENYASAVEKGWIDLPTAEDVPLCIDDIELPRWSYAASKIGGESAVFGAAPLGGFRPVVIRFHNVYGPRMALTHVIPEFLDRAIRRVDPFPVFGFDATRSFLYVEDAAKAVRTICDRIDAGPGIFNVGSPDEVSIAELVDLVFETTGFHPEVKRHAAPPGSVTRRVPDINKLTALGFKPAVSLKQGLKTCYEEMSKK